jgi:hypothetical protein
VRKDALGLYYSVNTLYMDGNVTEHSRLVPFTRYPSQSSTLLHLRQLRSIGVLVNLSDRCPNPANQQPQRSYSLEVTVSLSKNKNKPIVDLVGPSGATWRSHLLQKTVSRSSAPMYLRQVQLLSR